MLFVICTHKIVEFKVQSLLNLKVDTLCTESYREKVINILNECTCSLTLCILMDYSFRIDTINVG